MESIDKLREYVCDMTSVSSMTKANMSVYLDAIEREVEQLRDREYQNGREDARGAVEFADRLCRAAECREDVTLWGVDYTALPVDADGVPIHVGDALTDGKHTYTVTSVTFDSFAVTVCGHSETSLNSWPIDQPGKMRHHHEPTVEDVLREFVDALDIDRCEDFNATIAEYAARLRLAEGVDE